METPPEATVIIQFKELFNSYYAYAHHIPIDRPELIINDITKVIEEAKRRWGIIMLEELFTLFLGTYAAAIAGLYAKYRIAPCIYGDEDFVFLVEHTGQDWTITQTKPRPSHPTNH